MDALDAPDGINSEVGTEIRRAVYGAVVGMTWSQVAATTRAVLAVPAIADALRAAEEEEVYRTALGLACSDGWSDGESAMESYIETAKAHIAAMRAVDDSDIMPGCEFDGPVAL